MPATEDQSTQVILVDEKDREVGQAEKLAAHQQGLLHRAFSIFIFRGPSFSESELLLQQRAATKYHSPGLWTNTCCSHPSPGETLPEAAARRLKEEFNLLIPLEHRGQFQYRADFENGLIEHELDHVFVGSYSNEEILPNPEEIQAFRWVGIGELKKEIEAAPEKFTLWLAEALEIALSSQKK